MLLFIPTNYSPLFYIITADTWPMVFDDSNARRDWGWHHEYDTERLCKTMFEALVPVYGDDNIKLSQVGSA